MSKQNETGHAKNVANFEQLCYSITALGNSYNPSKELIKPEALHDLLENAKKTIVDYSEALSRYRMAAVERETAFEPLGKITTRVVNALKATDTSGLMDETAQSLARKIKGERASAKIAAAPAAADGTESETKQISAAQTSYDSRLDNWLKLIIHLQNIPQYLPNEPELKTTALQAGYDEMNIKNNQAKQAAVALDNARIARDKILYLPITGLTDIAFDTKVYVKSVFGASSPEFKQVSGIEFKSR